VRIGLNALYMIPGEVGGTETYARRLVEHLGAVSPADQFLLFSNIEAADSWRRLPQNVTVVPCGVRARSRPRRILWEQLQLPGVARRHGVDVLHSLGYTAPLRLGCPSVVTIHDLNYHFHPEDWSRSGLWANRALVPAAARQSDRVLTISESSKEAIREVLEVPDERIDVVYHGVDGNLASIDEATRARELAALGLEGEYLLSVSASHPHKNLDGLLAAYQRFCAETGRSTPLVIVGVPGRDHARITAAAQASGRGRVLLTGWVEEAALAALYQGAAVFVFASRYEGFGFPVLEAMSAGVPVVSSDATSLAELVTDAALSCGPDDVAAMATAIARLLDDPTLRADLVAKGRARAAQFTWQRAAEQTLAVYRRAL